MNNKAICLCLCGVLALSWMMLPVDAAPGGSDQAREYYAQGQQCIARGDYAGADEAFKKAQELLKASGMPPMPMAVQTAIVSQTIKAEPARTAPAKKGPRQPVDSVASCLERIKAKPNDADGYYNLGVEYLKAKKYGFAEQAFLRVLKLSPRDSDANYNLGVLYEIYLNDKQKAAAHYRAYLKYAAKSDDAWQVSAWLKDIKQSIKKDIE